MTSHTKKLIADDIKQFAKKLERKYKGVAIHTSKHIDNLFNEFRLTFYDKKNIGERDTMDEDLYQ